MFNYYRAGCLLLTLAVAASAHNESVHQDMVDLSYQVMVLVEKQLAAWERSSDATRNMRGDLSRDTVDQGRWLEFLRKVAATPRRYQVQGSGLGGVKAPAKTHCAEPIYEKSDLPAGWWNEPMGKIEFPPSIDFAGHGDCGVRKWERRDILAGLLGVDEQFRDHTGLVLGYWAASVDREFDDTHLWIRPTSVAGIGYLKDKVNSAVDDAVSVILIPFVCLADCIFSDCDSCDRDAKKLADDINPIDEVEGWLPGLGDISGDKWVGLWHHINMNDGASNDFDDHQGELFEEAGPFEIKDPLDIVLMAAFDVAGLSVDHDASRGVSRYEIGDPGDGMTPNRIRSKSQWQFTTIAHVPFEPVDNLAFFGWRAFREDPDHAVRNLAWPLHAMGDAIVPMHVTATSAWGHRPFEDSQVGLWPKVRFSNRSQDQEAFVMRILTNAFAVHTRIETFRASRASRGGNTDVPIRQIVTDLAAETRRYAMRKHGETGGDWPFSITASTEYAIDVTAANRGYENKASAVEHVRPLFESGIGTTIAFLVAAADSFPAQ